MTQANEIRRFWSWFATACSLLATLYEEKKFDDLSTKVNAELNKLDEELPWEIGPGKRTKYSFSFSPEGNKRLAELIRQLIASAPELKDWEIYATRRSRTPPGVIRFPESGTEISTSMWRFVPKENSKTGRLDLIIFGPELLSVDRDTGLKAISLYLDQSLGEEMVEEWIGRIEIERAPEGGKHYPIADLSDYLTWAVNRSDGLRR